jgi:calcineurin-like phosphoesterase family protein
MYFDYVTADTHFGHTNILLYESSRLQKMMIEGYDSFDEYMIEVWNDTIKPNDKILHLGDFAFANGYKTAKELKGDVTLLVGNHDKKEHINFYKKLDWKIIDKITLDIPKPHIVMNTLENEFTKEELNNPLLACLVCDTKDKRIMFSHFPIFDNNPYDKKYSKITKVLEYIFKETKCDINIHGHTHSHKAKESFCKSACLELNDFNFLTKEDIF